MSTFYERRILNAENIEVRHALSDPLGGIVAPDDVTLELSNVDGFFNSQDLRGTVIDLTRFDREDSESVLEFSGAITEQTISDDKAVVRLVSQDQDVLQTLIPKRTITSSIFPLAHADQGLGRTVPIVFGTVLSPYPVPFVTDNTSSNVYDYLIGEGSSYTNVAMYRDTVGDILSLVSSTEYSLNTTSYSGFTVARFPLRQAQFGGGLHTLYATVAGMQPESNFVRAIRTTLTNSVWGVSQQVHDTTFSSVESLLATVGSLACDGVLTEPRPAIDVLNQLCQVRGMTLSKTSSSAWTIAIDQGSSTATFQSRFGHGAGQPWNNAKNFSGFQRSPVRDAVSRLALDYAIDYRSEKYRNTVTRSVLSIGRERRIANDFIQTGVTADKVVDYIAKRLIQGDLKTTFDAGQEGRNLVVGDLILYDAPHLDVTSRPFRITEIARRLDSTKVAVEGWASSIYSYSAVSSIPPDVTIPAESLWSVTTPSAPTSLMIIGSGTTTNSQGGYTAFQTLRYNIVDEAFAQTFVRQRTSGNSQWLTVAVDQLTGNNLTTRIDPLITGLPYDYHVDRVNLLDPSLHASTTISSQTAPKDNAAPGTPGTPTITGQHLKDITFQWTESTGGDVKDYEWEVRTAASGGGSQLATSRAGTVKTSLTLNSASYDTTYYFRVRAKDYSGNEGSWSADRSFSFSQVATGDVGNNVITAYGTYSNDATVNVGTTEVELGTITLSTDSGVVSVFGKAVVIVTGGHRHSFRLRKDSLTGGVLDLTEIGDTATMLCAALIGNDASPASSQTYKFTGQKIIGTGTDPVVYRRMRALNEKK